MSVTDHVQISDFGDATPESMEAGFRAIAGEHAAELAKHFLIAAWGEAEYESVIQYAPSSQNVFVAVAWTYSILSPQYTKPAMAKALKVELGREEQ